MNPLIQSHKSTFSSSPSLETLKAQIQNQRAQLCVKFNAKENVGHLLINHAQFIDDLLSSSWEQYLGEFSCQPCLIATGGYGRNELFPYSDIDLMVLLESSDITPFKDQLSTFFNLLWDIGLKPGHCVRTIPECIDAAASDQTIMTSLLEMRLIRGNSDLFDQLKQEIHLKTIWSSESFFAAKMQEQRQRYAKYHDTAYNLEPNTKEGPGGLRDLQNIAWVFKYHYSTATLKELIDEIFLSKSEYDELIKLRDFLWRIRFALHCLTQRCEDRLLFDTQRDLARQFGFINAEGHPDVESFMQNYFKTVREMERMNEIMLQLYNEKLIDKAVINELKPFNPSFVSINGYLEAKHPETFINHPLALLEVFTLLQQNSSLKGIRASTIRLIRSNLYLIDDDFRRNKKANQIFLSLFRSTRGITHQIRLMNRHGILAAYLPCYAHIVARMQYDLFHIYTVDAHTLFVIRNLRRFSLEKHYDELPFCNSIFMRISEPMVLYLAALFHDIAKGMNGDHSELGEKIALEFCQQHKIGKHNTKLITWLVRNHLMMSTTAQRKDISDPEVIHKFALLVGSIEYLNHLYLLTVADIRATSPSLWNSWKDSLLMELYTSTHSALHRGLQNPIARTERLYENKQEARDELLGLGISEATIQKTWQRINDDYFLRYSSEEIAWHTIAIAACQDDELPLVILRPQNARGSVEIFVYTLNSNHIFSISAATLDRLGLTILDARIVTIPVSQSEQHVFNSFQVLEQSGEAIKDISREVHICRTLRNNLKNKAINSNTLLNRRSRQARHFPIQSRVNFHKDPLSRYTIVELITTDQDGLLAAIGQVFIKLDVQLHDAKITTIGSRVEDMFYITDSQTKAITDESTLNEIKKEILTVANDTD